MPGPKALVSLPALSLTGTFEPGDRTYLAELVASRTGLSQEDAEKRVDDTMAQIKAVQDKAKQAADAARKASAKASFYLFFSMLIGAFIASTAGAIGGAPARPLIAKAGPSRTGPAFFTRTYRSDCRLKAAGSNRKW